MTPAHSLRPAARLGATLVELLAAIGIAGLVATVATRTFREQRRALRGSVELAEMRSQLRQGMHLLATELRPIAPSEGDMHAWSETRLIIRSMAGSSVICRRSSDSTFVLPPIDAGATLTSWLVAPQPGDSLRVFDEGSALDLSDDTWHAHEIAAVTRVSGEAGCAAGSGAEDGNAAPAIRLRIAGDRLSPTVGEGASVRIFHPVRYEVYQSGDGLWYLGASDCRAARSPPCSTIQPVSGPYRSRTADGIGAGLELAYFDAVGTRLDPGYDDARRIARVDVVLRAETRTPMRLRHNSSRGFQDSVRLSVAVRNRDRP